MTISIVARCARSGQFGIGATTAMPAVGKLLTHAAAGVGAIATHALLNPYLGIDGLTLLQQRLSAQDVVELLKRSDPRIEARQFAVIDGAGRAVAFTGEECPDWAGQHEEEGFSVQGNRLAGPQVLEAAVAVLQRTQQQDVPLVERFVLALAAAKEAGGDKKGEKSAALYVMDTEEYPLWDIRVDYHDQPVAELHRLYTVFRNALLPHIKEMPTRKNPAGGADETSV